MHHDSVQTTKEMKKAIQERESEIARLRSRQTGSIPEGEHFQSNYQRDTQLASPHLKSI